MGGGSYCAVKAALIGLTQSIAADYGAQGIRANLVAPGVVRTDMTEGFWETEGFKRTNHELTPFNRDCTIEDVANAVYFLASDRSEEHTSDQSLMRNSYAVFCLKKKNNIKN